MGARVTAVVPETLTPTQERVVWERWFQSEVRALYFADLASRYRRRQSPSRGRVSSPHREPWPLWSSL